jgi:hypothetical protein
MPRDAIEFATATVEAGSHRCATGVRYVTIMGSPSSYLSVLAHYGAQLDAEWTRKDFDSTTTLWTRSRGNDIDYIILSTDPAELSPYMDANVFNDAQQKYKTAFSLHIESRPKCRELTLPEHDTKQ